MLFCRFEKVYRYLQNEHYAGQWAVAKRSFRSLQNCDAQRTYSAVGWGGHQQSNSASYPSEWSVLLRAGGMSGDPRLPRRCDTALPDLSPGRYWPGVTAIDYRLMVCGGHPSGGNLNDYGHQCFYLDTNSEAENPAWASMDDMPNKRGYFEFVAYGDAAYAIAGYGASGEIKKVDRWTRRLGWQTVNQHSLTKATNCYQTPERKGSCLTKCIEHLTLGSDELEVPVWNGF